MEGPRVVSSMILQPRKVLLPSSRAGGCRSLVVGRRTARLGPRTTSPGTCCSLNDNGAWSWFQDERAIVDPAPITCWSAPSATGRRRRREATACRVASFNLATRRSRLAPGHDRGRRPQHPRPAHAARRSLSCITRRRLRRAYPHQPLDQPWRPDVMGREAQLHQPGRRHLQQPVSPPRRRRAALQLHANHRVRPELFRLERPRCHLDTRRQLLQDPNNSDGRALPEVRVQRQRPDRLHHDRRPPPRLRQRHLSRLPQEGKLHRSDGTEVGELGSAPSRQRVYPRVHPTAARNHGWTTDLTLDDAGNPVAVFTTRVDDLAA